MATTKPRITISLPPNIYATYKRFAELSQRPAASVISELLGQAQPHIEQLGVLLQQAHQLKNNGTDEERAKFIAKIDMGLHRTVAASDLLYSDLVTSAQIPGEALAEPGSAPQSPAKRVPKRSRTTKK